MPVPVPVAVPVDVPSAAGPLAPGAAPGVVELWSVDVDEPESPRPPAYLPKKGRPTNGVVGWANSPQ